MQINSLSKKMIDEMTKPQLVFNVGSLLTGQVMTWINSVGWGLGWAIDSTASGKIVLPNSGANRTGIQMLQSIQPLQKEQEIVIYDKWIKTQRFCGIG